MRPIKLQFSGLNSYRSLQVVDFAALGGEGLFGIFGPTGSGKSSILDAITLALYGAVDRASNNTRGIIHLQEQALTVAFEFALGGCRYLVERRYERNGKDPESAVAKLARLRRFSPEGEEEVLASKPQDVTAQIEEILGIRREEFTRAVVLPQGKFDQFLRLSGAERAAMLEHLFNFEQFGEALVVKVKGAATACLEQLQRIEGEEQGLGDCSKEALDRAETELKAKTTECQAVQKAFDDADRAFKEAEVLSDLAAKRKAALARKAELQQRRPVMEEKQNRLHLADRAEPLRELLLRQGELAGRIRKEQEVYEEKLRQHQETETRYVAIKYRLEQAEKTYNEQFPRLQEERAEYKRGLEQQRKYDELQKNAREKEEELAGIVRAVDGFEEETAAGQRELTEVKDALAALQQKRAQLQFNAEEKDLVEQGLDVLRRLEECEGRLAEREQVCRQRLAARDEQWATCVAVLHQMLPERDAASGDDLGAWAKEYVAGVEGELATARTSLQRALIQNSAAELVKELHAGEPCPVCGSLEHPRPAQPSGELDHWQALIKTTENKLREARIWEERLRNAWQAWENNAFLAREAQEELVRIQREQEALQADFELVRGPLDRSGLRKRKEELAEAERQLQRIDREREVLLRKQDAINERLEKAREMLQASKIKEASVQEVLKNIHRQLGEVAGELARLTGGRDLAALAEETEQALARLRQELEAAKGDEQASRQTVEELAKERVAFQATLETNRQELADVTERLSAGLAEAGFADPKQAEAALLPAGEREGIRRELEEYRQAWAVAEKEVARLEGEMAGRSFDEAAFASVKEERNGLLEKVDRLKAELTLAKDRLGQLQAKQVRWQELQRQKTAVEKRRALAEELSNLLRGKRFVSFLAQEHLRDMTLEASYQLGRLSGQRYALELAKEKDCEFVIRDDYNGGNRRAVNTLSGGEIFLTSLSLALALSSKIQLRGRYPLGFFFLDEGFGTLDEEKLDKVMSALEKLHDKNRMVGIISHVRELKERLPRYLEVIPAGEDGQGSRIQMH